MLFDVRGGKRRRLVQVVYGSLAILMGGGLVLFGIGGEVSGGLFDAFRDEQGRANASEQFQERIDEQEKKLVTNPKDTVALAQIAKLHAQLAGADENFNTDQGRFTAGGIAELRKADTTWQRYLKAKPKKVDGGLAVIMAQQVYGAAGLNKPEEAVKAWEQRLATGEATSGLYAQYAQLAYIAKQNRKGDLAADRAVELAPDGQGKALREQLESVKTQLITQSLQQGSGAGTDIVTP